MSYKDTLTYASNMADSGCLTTSNAGDYWEYTTPTYQMPTAVSIPTVWTENPYEWKYLEGSLARKIINKGGEDMRYLYEVILVNPKNDAYEIYDVTAKSETSALMEVYKISQEDIESEIFDVDFDDLKTQCRILMEWKKEKDLKKAIETIKEAVK